MERARKKVPIEDSAIRDMQVIMYNQFKTLEKLNIISHEWNFELGGWSFILGTWFPRLARILRDE